MSKAANVRQSNGHRRRRLRKRVLAHYSTCHLCDEPVNKALHHLHPLAPEVDEITPVSHGGDPLAWGNVQLAHRICNQRRGDKRITNQLRAELRRQRQQDRTTDTQPVTSRHW